MDKKNIEIITPTIINKFNKLTALVHNYTIKGATVEFFGEDDKLSLYYDEKFNEIFYSPKYFMLHYFGYNGYDESSLDDFLVPLFTKLINDKLGYTLVKGNSNKPKTPIYPIFED